MKKKEGFSGQCSYVIVEKIISHVKNNMLISDLYLTDIGYYPLARFHFRERKMGCEQNILIYNVKGKGKIWINNQLIILRQDHCIIIPAGTPHKYSSDDQDPWSIYWIHYSGKKSHLFLKHANQAIAIERNQLSRIGERIDLFSEIFVVLEKGFSIENLEFVNLSLGRLLSSFTHLNQFRKTGHASETNPVVRSINYMIENFNLKLSLDRIAESAGCSKSHFSRLFKNHIGHSPSNYFTQLRIQRACRLLDLSSLSIADVARETGFEDQYYFSRVFKKVIGTSPSNFRKKLRG